MELGLGVGLLSKWNGLTFFLFIFIANERIITYSISMPGPNQHIFLFYAP